MPNYRPKTARLYHTAGNKWRIGATCVVAGARLPIKKPAIARLDRNMGNVAMPDIIIKLAPRPGS